MSLVCAISSVKKHRLPVPMSSKTHKRTDLSLVQQVEIVQLINENKFSQVDLGKHFDCSQSTILKIAKKTKMLFYGTQKRTGSLVASERDLGRMTRSRQHSLLGSLMHRHEMPQ